ncbi:hypothetical protein M0802_006993 [Mischocyttarus mexicanus]|nr:hypothetical protein M0802_006993 [Mischocyttarus mexicanus]
MCCSTCIVITFMGTFRPESLRIWITHPHNRRNVQSDLLIFTLLTVVMIGLIIVCLWGMHYFIIEGKKIGISKSWTRAVIWLFLGIVILGYIMTVYLLGKDQLLPWYRWWKSTVNVQLIVDPELFRPTTESFQEYENQIMSISASNMKTPTESRERKLVTQQVYDWCNAEEATILLAVGNPDAAKTKIVDVSIGWKQAKPIRFDAAYNEQRFIYQADQPEPKVHLD